MSPKTKAAKKDIHDNAILILDDASFKRFENSIVNPPEPSQRFRQAAQAKRPWNGCKIGSLSLYLWPAQATATLQENRTIQAVASTTGYSAKPVESLQRHQSPGLRVQLLILLRQMMD